MLTDAEYVSYRDVIERKFKMALARAQAEHKSDLDALERIRQLSVPQQQEPLGGAFSLHLIEREKVEATSSFRHELPSGENVVGANRQRMNLVSPPAQRGELKEAVLCAIYNMEGAFRSTDIEQWIKLRMPALAGSPTTSISSALKRLEMDGHVVLMQQGAGQVPSIYRKKVT